MKKLKYWILYHICFGKFREKFRQKYKKAKEKEVKKFIEMAEEYYRPLFCNLVEKIDSLRLTLEIKRLPDESNGVLLDKLTCQINSLNLIKKQLINALIWRNIERLGRKLQNGARIRVAFFVIWASQFTSSRIYEMMLKDPMFDPFIVVCRIPDMTGENRERFQTVFDENLAEMRARYGNVKANWYNGEYIDLSEEYDIAVYHVLYPPYYSKFYEVPYLTNKGILSIFIAYGFHIAASSEKEMLEGVMRYEYLLYTLVYIDNNITGNKIKTIYENTRYFGYPKLDNLADHKPVRHERPVIILAPHQDLEGTTAGTFLNTWSLYLEVPKKFPDIDFIFRPHPLWLPNLQLKWGREKAEKYLEQVLSMPNVTYSTEGDYYQIFTDSDAMIHDCGSFLPEYMCTGKPSLYLKDDEEIIKKSFNTFVQEVIKYTYLGHTLDVVENFINDIVVGKNDYMKDDRMRFAQEKLLGNYPHTSLCILNDLKKILIDKA